MWTFVVIRTCWNMSTVDIFLSRSCYIKQCFNPIHIAFVINLLVKTALYFSTQSRRRFPDFYNTVIKNNYWPKFKYLYFHQLLGVSLLSQSCYLNHDFTKIPLFLDLQIALYNNWPTLNLISSQRLTWINRSLSEC